MSTSHFNPSETYARPVHQFDGDGVLPPDAYAACADGQGYLLVSNYLLGAATSYGLARTPAREERLRRVLFTANRLDDWLDGPGVKAERYQEYDGIVGKVFSTEQQGQDDVTVADEPELSNALLLLHNAVRPLPEAANETLRRTARSLGKMSCLKAKARTAAAVRFAARGEAVHTGHLFGGVIIADENLSLVPQRRLEDFMEWSANTVAAVTLVDTGIDLPKDYRDALVGARPTVRARASLITAGLTTAASMLRSKPQRDAWLAASRHDRERIAARLPFNVAH